MTTRRRSSASRVASQLGSLSLAAPQVVAHRVSRMAMAGPFPSARDQREFTGMVVEKQLAFAQSLTHMWFAGTQVQQELMLAWVRGVFSSQWMNPAFNVDLTHKAHKGGMSVLSRGLAPIERKAASNARRLARTRKS